MTGLFITGHDEGQRGPRWSPEVEPSDRQDEETKLVWWHVAVCGGFDSRSGLSQGSCKWTRVAQPKLRKTAKTFVDGIARFYIRPAGAGRIQARAAGGLEQARVTMRLATIISTASAAAATSSLNYYDGGVCGTSLRCLQICKQGDFKVVQDAAGQPQLACAEGIVEYSRKLCQSRSGDGKDSVALLRDACAQARGSFCENYCVVPARDPGGFDDKCRGMEGMPSTIMGGLTEEQAKGQEVCT